MAKKNQKTEQVVEQVVNNDNSTEQVAPIETTKQVREYHPTKKEFRIMNSNGEEVQTKFNLREWCRSMMISYTRLYYTLRSGRPCPEGYRLERNYEFQPNAPCLVRKPRRKGNETEEQYGERMKVYEAELAALRANVKETPAPVPSE